MDSHQLTDDLTQFWSRYTRSLETFSSTELAAYYELPTLFLEENFSQAITSQTGLILRLDQLRSLYRQEGTFYFQFHLLNVRYLSPHLLSVDVIWQHFDTQHAPLFERTMTYILRWQKDHAIRISVSISLPIKDRRCAGRMNQDAEPVHVTGFMSSPSIKKPVES